MPSWNLSLLSVTAISRKPCDRYAPCIQYGWTILTTQQHEDGFGCPITINLLLNERIDTGRH